MGLRDPAAQFSLALLFVLYVFVFDKYQRINRAKDFSLYPHLVQFNLLCHFIPLLNDFFLKCNSGTLNAPRFHTLTLIFTFPFLQKNLNDIR